MTPTSSTMMHHGGRTAEASPLFIRGKKALAPSASGFLPLMNSGDASAVLPPWCIIVDEVGVMG